MTFVIAIDGPAGSGKSTVGAEVARRLATDRLDTGAMYRAVAWAAREAGIDPGDGQALGELAARLRMEVGHRVLVDGRDVSEQIRAPGVSAVVSTVAAHAPVREVLVREQRAWAAARDLCVVEGRDIGSVVFPDAKVKIFLTAEPAERAARRARGARRHVLGRDRRAGGSDRTA